MADPASLALGIIPLVGVAFKSYAAVYKKISTFVHCSTKLQRIHKRFKFQRRIFENECHLLLRFAIPDTATINSMKTNPDHENWSKKTIDDELKQQLGANYELCLEVVHDIGSALSWLQDQLRGFDALQRHQLNGEDMKQTLKRLQGQVTIAINESTYDKALADIKNANSDLGALREQITALADKSQDKEAEESRRARSISTDCVPDTTVGWNTLCKVRRASKALYDVLAEVWSCQEVDHTRHLVNLAIQLERRPYNADFGTGDIYMDLVLVSWARNATTGYKSRLLPLLVRSQMISQPWVTIDRPLTVRTLHKRTSSFPPRSGLAKSDSVQELDTRPKKRTKVVRFDTPSGDNVMDASNPSSSLPVDSGNGDLRRSKSICSDLAETGPDAPSRPSSTTMDQSFGQGCLGFLDIHSDQVYRHSFHKKHTPGESMTSYDTEIWRCSMNSLDSFLDAVGEKSLQLTVVDKLNLARSLVHAVLQYHCTPWMKELWKLGDISFLPHGTEDGNILSSPIKSLYLGVEFCAQRCHLAASRDEDKMRVPSACIEQINECRVVYGVTNLTLHSLGAALLQIDQWSATGVIQPQDVPAIRKMALRPSSLGPRFDDIIQRCIKCRFNYGFDLNRPQMQKEVYDKLVTPLEDMIASMSLNDDVDDDGFG
ncbi:hypothetical protein V8F33_007354 [Rhypophila sp. PSN 637]